MSVDDSKPVKVQVLIVGSGAGGATTASVLAEAGFQVVVLEEGRRHELTEYGTNPTKAMPLLYRNSGMTPILGSVPIGYVEGRCMAEVPKSTAGYGSVFLPNFACAGVRGMTWQMPLRRSLSPILNGRKNI